MTFPCRSVASFSTGPVPPQRQTCNDIPLFLARTQTKVTLLV